jgi:tRNA nucleotidyltransferase (CCA-adding enzyme)
MNSALLTERAFAEIIAENGGRVFRVGGCVRDWFMGFIPKDIDFCVVGMVKKNFKAIFPDVQEYGKSFPVFRLLIDGIQCEVAFARTERKVGRGYKGFKISSNPKVTIEEDLFRRDTTVNSIAIDSLTGEIIDPFHGREDIKNGILRATSQHFSDDPMRALRLAGQSARLGFKVDQDTLNLAGAVASELAEEPVERILVELTKVLTGALEPSRFFRVLAEMNLLQTTFREISDLSVECFEETMVKLDLVSSVTQKPKLKFAIFGLILTREELSQWNQRMTLPGAWLESAIAVSKIKILLEENTAEKVVDAIHSLRRGSLSAEELDIISMAVGLKIPALGPLAAMMLLPDQIVPQQLKGREVGDWLRLRQVELVSEKLRCLECE